MKYIIISYCLHSVLSCLIAIIFFPDYGLFPASFIIHCLIYGIMLGVGLVIPYLDLKNTANEFAITAIIGYASINLASISISGSDVAAAIRAVHSGRDFFITTLPFIVINSGVFIYLQRLNADVDEEE